MAKRIKKQKALISKNQFDIYFEKFKKLREQLLKTRFLKYQEKCSRVHTVKDGKDRSITPIPDSSTIKTDKNRSATPDLCMNTASKRMAYPMNIENDSSYEDEFSEAL